LVRGTVGRVTTLSRSDRPLFDRREFAGYLKRRIPHPLDDKVLTAVVDPRKRAAMTPEDVSVLAVFGHRKAVEAVRNSDIQALSSGFLAAAIAVELQGDMRDVFMGLAPLFRSAGLLGARTEDIVAGLTSAGASAQSVDEIRRFAERPLANRSLEAFGLREEGSGSDFRYV
jgi:hypothetical protein